MLKGILDHYNAMSYRQKPSTLCPIFKGALVKAITLFSMTTMAIAAGTLSLPTANAFDRQFSSAIECQSADGYRYAILQTGIRQCQGETVTEPALNVFYNPQVKTSMLISEGRLIKTKSGWSFVSEGQDGTITIKGSATAMGTIADPAVYKVTDSQPVRLTCDVYGLPPDC